MKKSSLVILCTLVITCFACDIYALNSYTENIHNKATKSRMAVSFGLYGNNPKYTIGALVNAELVPKIYPGWQAVFYVDQKTVPEEIINGLKARGALVITKGEWNNTMFARFLIADHPDFDRFIVRDVDSRLTNREKEAVQEWINSGKLMHNMRDHMRHDQPVMGGLWGGTKNMLKGHKMIDLISKWHNKVLYNQDQSFLNKVVLSIVGEDNILSHDSYYCRKYPNSLPFPTQRPFKFKDFVGQIYVRDAFGDKPLANPGPEPQLECRYIFA